MGGGPLDPKDTQLFSSGQREGAFFSISSPFSPASCAPSAPWYFRLNQALRADRSSAPNLACLFALCVPLCFQFDIPSSPSLAIFYYSRIASNLSRSPSGSRENSEISDSPTCIYVYNGGNEYTFGLIFVLIVKELGKDIFLMMKPTRFPSSISPYSNFCINIPVVLNNRITYIRNIERVKSNEDVDGDSTGLD